MRDTPYYYNISDGWPIEDIIAQWAEDGRKVYESSMPVYYRPEELWPYRDYDRVPPPQLIASMRREGWRKHDPAIIIVSRQGHAYLGEGNHRLAAAIELGIQVPARFVFWQQSKKPLEMRRAEPPQVDPDVIGRVAPGDIERFIDTGRVPLGCVFERGRLRLDPKEPPPRPRRRPPRKPRGPHYGPPSEEQVQEPLDLLNGGYKKNPKARIQMGRDEADEPIFEEVQGTRPRGVPDWLMITQPPEEQRTKKGRIPPGGWALTHVPTGLAVMKGLSKADAAIAARVVARDMPFLADITEQVTPAELSRDPYRSALERTKTLQHLLMNKADSLRGENVGVISELLRNDLVSRRELAGLSASLLTDLLSYDLLTPAQLHSLPAAKQVAIDDELERRGQESRENPPVHDLRDGIVAVLGAYRGNVIDEHLAIEVAQELAEAFDADDAVEELANAMMIREGLVLDAAIIRERANNIVMLLVTWD